MDVEVQGSKPDLHSGYHGGIVPNPLLTLVSLLGSLRDQKGKIAAPGFYDDVKEMPQQKRSLVSFHFDETEYTQQAGAQPTGGKVDFDVLERAWRSARPWRSMAFKEGILERG